MRFSSCSARVSRFVLVALLLGGISSPAQVTTAPKQGIRENDPRLHALTNARIVTAPGKTIEKGTVLIRDGVIVEAGPDVKVPPEARVWDLAGKTIYPGFIDAYSRLGLPETLQPEPVRPDIDYDDPKAKPKEIPRESAKGMHSWNAKVTPERKAADYLNLDKKATRKLRELGFTSALVVPGRGIFRGSSALINLQESDVNTLVVAPSVAQHIAFDFYRSNDGGYPNSLMGCIALIRQTFLDASWYQAAQDAYRKNPGTTERPETNASLARWLSTRNASKPPSSKRMMSWNYSVPCASPMSSNSSRCSSGTDMNIECEKPSRPQRRRSFCRSIFQKRPRSNALSKRWNMGSMNSNTGIARPAIRRGSLKLAFHSPSPRRNWRSRKRNSGRAFGWRSAAG